MVHDDTTTELALVRAARQGDPAAWGVLVQRCYPAVLTYLRWRCANQLDAVDDVMQETWMNAARVLRQFDPTRGGLTAWVCGLAANSVRRHWRRSKQSVRRRVPIPEDVEGAAEPDPPDAEWVAAVLHQLSETDETLLRWKYYEGCAVQEIATRLGKSTKAVESALTRAREAFRKLAQQGEAP
jgi:RNA polymerase sigma-70 factor, ECF subfamily